MTPDAPSPTGAPQNRASTRPRLRGRYNGASSLAWTGGWILGPAFSGAALRAGLAVPLLMALVAGCGLAGLGPHRLRRHLPAHTDRTAAAAGETNHDVT